MTTAQHFFASGNTSRGYVQLFDAAFMQVEQVLKITGLFEADVQLFISALARSLESDGEELCYIHCPSNPDQYDAIIIPSKKIGIINLNEPRKLSGDIRSFHISLESIYNGDTLKENEEVIRNYKEQMVKAHQQAYQGYAQALKIHDAWEAIFIGNMNFEKADQIAASYIEKLFSTHRQHHKEEGAPFYRFLGAATPIGAVDFIPQLTRDLTRYFIKGRPGSGKSTFLKQIAAAGLEKGYDMEIYHCGLDPQSLDMVICRELSFAVFDSTAPHEYYPNQDQDFVIDMYSLCINPGTDEENEDVLAEIKRKYSSQMKLANQHLSQALTLQEKLSEIVKPAIDQSIWNDAIKTSEQYLSEMQSSKN